MKLLLWFWLELSKWEVKALKLQQDGISEISCNVSPWKFSIAKKMSLGMFSAENLYVKLNNALTTPTKFMYNIFRMNFFSYGKHISKHDYVESKGI